eukprot:TCALIF_10959-PB protein Name:"Protein of unknown function" AED:0.51 eAED:0.51 QI:0/0.14/0.75/0.87/0.42/0.5/8/0/318
MEHQPDVEKNRKEKSPWGKETTKERRPRFCQSDDFVGQMPTETKKDNLEVAEWEVRKALAGLGTTNIEEIRKLMPDDFNKKLQQWETKKQASCGPSLAEVGSKSSRSPKSQNKKSGNDAMKRNTVDSDGDGDLPWIERELRKIQREQENLDLDRAKAPKIEIRWKSGGQLFHQNSGGSRGIQSHSRFSVDNGGVVLENLCHLPIRLQTSEHSTSIEVLLAQEESPNEWETWMTANYLGALAILYLVGSTSICLLCKSPNQLIECFFDRTSSKLLGGLRLVSLVGVLTETMDKKVELSNTLHNHDLVMVLLAVTVSQPG